MAINAMNVSIDAFNLNKSTETTSKKLTKSTSADLYSSSASRFVENKKSSFDDSLKTAANKTDNSSKVKKDDNFKKVDKGRDKEDVKVVDEEEVDEKVNNSSKDDINEILASISNILNNYIDNQESQSKNINSDILEAIMNKINDSDGSTNLSKLLEQLTESMKNSEVGDALSSDSLRFMEKLLNQLSVALSENDNLANPDLKANINNLISQISEMAADKQGDKVLGLEEMLGKNFSADDQSLFEQSDDAMKNADKSSSKEDDFLNKLLGKDDAAATKINMYATRQTMQTQAAQPNNNLSVNKLTFADDLIKDVKFMTTNAIKELTVKVNPGNLGEITIKLVQEDGIMKANLKANSKETAALLTQNVEEIKSKLSEQNVKIAEVNIELYQDDTTFYSQQGFEGELAKQDNNSASNNNVTKIQAGVEESIDETTEAVDDSNINFLA